MSLRLAEKVVLPLAGVAGCSLAPGIFDGDAGRLFVIFLGLVSASVLPTVSLLVNTMSSSGRSVAAINDLDRQLRTAMDAMFFFFGCVTLVVIFLTLLAIPSPWPLSEAKIGGVEVLPRLGQGAVFTATAALLMRLGQIPAIFRRTLDARHQIAIEEAKRETIERLAEGTPAKKSFARKPDFGKSIDLKEVGRQ